MKRALHRTGLALLASVAAIQLACDTDDKPQVNIVTPSAGSTVALGQDMKIRVTITANDFELKRPGDCKGEDNCGVAYLNIDGDGCNQPGQAYNNVLGDGTLGQDFFIEALFLHCPVERRTGSHNITVSLRDQNGQPIIGAGDVPAQATISIVTTM
jgi:hypothetical protein